jgi:HD-like signal output (HDOD) protein
MAATAALTQEDVEKILKGITIPSPPQIIADLQIEMAMPDPDLNDMAKLISKDVGLSGSILKTINSPFYGGRNADSIPHAVMMLGMSTIINIVNTIYLRDSARSSEMSDEMYKAFNNFWDSATDVARVCQLISQRIRFHHADTAYMLGLFHNAGIPLMMQRFDHYPKIMVDAYSSEAGRVIDIENQLLQSNHAVLSFYVARSWKLPDILCNVIGQHHNGLEIFTTDNNLLTHDEKFYLAILKVAEHITSLYRILGNQENDREWQECAPQVLEYLGISDHDFEDICAYASDMGIGEQAYFM